MNDKEFFNDFKQYYMYIGSLNELSEQDYDYDDIYHDENVYFLQRMCNKYDIKFNENENDWEWCNYFQNKEWELENKFKEILKERYFIKL